MEDFGRIAFNAYNDVVGGLTWDGKPIPPFDDLTDKIRSAWTAAAQAVIAEVTPDDSDDDSDEDDDSIVSPY